ncbi:MAG: dephospho-CoA kinase [Actinomycetota bacterium]
MVLIGLSGGFASGKSTVAGMLEARGAVVMDADRIAHEVISVAGPAYPGVVDRFGPGILGPEGRIDRGKLARVVFADPQARRDLEAITHPAIFTEIARRLASLGDQAQVVVLDAALLVETGAHRGPLPMAALVVVAAEVEDQLKRAARQRGIGAKEARARIASQAPIEAKLAAADYVIDNRGGLPELERSVDALWEDVLARFGPGRAG